MTVKGLIKILETIDYDVDIFVWNEDHHGRLCWTLMPDDFRLGDIRLKQIIIEKDEVMRVEGE